MHRPQKETAAWPQIDQDHWLKSQRLSPKIRRLISGFVDSAFILPVCNYFQEQKSKCLVRN